MSEVYGCCAGQFMPLQGAQPTIGTVGAEERVEEDRVEVLADLGPASEHTPSTCPPDIPEILAELRKVSTCLVL